MKKTTLFLTILFTALVTAISYYCIQNFLLTPASETDVHQTQNFEIPNDVKAVENTGFITVAGTKTPLSGEQLKVGDILNDVVLDKRADYFDQVTTTSLADFAGYKVIETVPSLDTPVCTMQTKQLEFAAGKFPNVNFIVVSNDTPFALQRFCAGNKINNLQVVSDARTREFGTQNALLMSDYNLLTRAIMIVDTNNEIKYIEYANEVTQELDLMNALAKLQQLTTESK